MDVARLTEEKAVCDQLGIYPPGGYGLELRRYDINREKQYISFAFVVMDPEGEARRDPETGLQNPLYLYRSFKPTARHYWDYFRQCMNESNPGLNLGGPDPDAARLAIDKYYVIKGGPVVLGGVLNVIISGEYAGKHLMKLSTVTNRIIRECPIYDAGSMTKPLPVYELLRK